MCAEKLSYREWSNKDRPDTDKNLFQLKHIYEGGSESSVIGGVTLLIDMTDCCIIP